MKVRMLVQTTWDGPKVPGEVVDVAKDVADRWTKNGIAEPVEDTKRIVQRKPNSEG